MELGTDFRKFERTTQLSRSVGRKNDLMTAHRISQRRQRHRLVKRQRRKKCLKLRLIRMIGYISAVEHLQTHLAPRMLVKPREIDVEFFVENRSFTTNKMRMEIVWLETVDNGRTLSDPTVGEF